MPLKAGEDPRDFLGLAQLGDGVADGVVVLELEKRRELVAVEFADADLDVLGENKVEKRLLLGIEARSDVVFGLDGVLRG